MKSHALPALIAATLMLALGACASGPDFRTEGVSDLTPESTLADGESAQGERVLWGGRILAVRPLEHGTQLELLAFPLRRNHMPDQNQSSQGRFLVMHSGFLEPADWSPDRLVTVSGVLDGFEDARIGEATYRYPVVRPDDLHLWPADASRAGSTSSGVNFGFGVILSR